MVWLFQLAGYLDQEEIWIVDHLQLENFLNKHFELKARAGVRCRNHSDFKFFGSMDSGQAGAVTAFCSMLVPYVALTGSYLIVFKI